eukprot:TRINITY_DN37336_c0_g2_i1.p1 TRINITY_DN37336_c0_g2~~TRINITY_DN37336_c0_g2_i1.p1  ORF type:complete len:228 (+),score=15.45 TRINITY_DN37336_c0_g2_i1:530-1213(+)
MNHMVSAKRAAGTEQAAAAQCEHAADFTENWSMHKTTAYNSAVICGGCAGDFTMLPCNAVAAGRAYPECGHIRYLDMELICWLHYGAANAPGQSWAKHHVKTTVDLNSPYVLLPAGCAVLHQEHGRPYRKRKSRKRRETGNWTSKFDVCYGENQKRWWRTRNASFATTARPECWGACNESLHEVRYRPSLASAEALWEAAMARHYPLLDQQTAQRLAPMARVAWNEP